MDIYNKLKEMKILIIDDDKWIRSSLSLLFESEGCHLLALETAEEGIKAIKNQAYDIVIADYRLPGMDGLEFFRRIHDTQPHAMKMLITAYKDGRIVSEAAKIGIQDFIEKPFTMKTIEQALTWLIKEHEQIEKKHIRGI